MKLKNNVRLRERGVMNKSKVIHWLVDCNGRTACKSSKEKDKCSFSLFDVTCKKCLRTKESINIIAENHTKGKRI